MQLFMCSGHFKSHALIDTKLELVDDGLGVEEFSRNGWLNLTKIHKMRSQFL